MPFCLLFLDANVMGAVPSFQAATVPVGRMLRLTIVECGERQLGVWHQGTRGKGPGLCLSVPCPRMALNKLPPL